MNSWLPCDKWQHLLGSACLFCSLYFFFKRLKRMSYPKYAALIFALFFIVVWEVGQLIAWPLDWPDAGYDLLAGCAGIFTMWRMAV